MNNQSLKGLKEKLCQCKNPDTTSSNPIFFDLRSSEDCIGLEKLLDQGLALVVHDRVGEQLKELFKIRNPEKKYSDLDLTKLLEVWLSENDINKYGVWVYYPWNTTLVHLVPKNEFIELRTSRNKYKITQEEQDTLATKIIGVVGLSVGQSVSITMAIERAFGTIRIADFDTLELTNLNRIRQGIDKLGLSKVLMVAREIYEIDPFLNIEIFPEGLNMENIDEFFTKNGSLDILVEECDSLDIKVLARLKAKELGVPVVMDTSDRGMLDIERFDLERERPIFHGLVPEDQLKNLKDLSTEQKIPYILKMVGAETLSKRFKASMFEVESSITTWPQLSSSVTMGGAFTTDLCRRILLDQLHVSGRFFIDIEELISDKEEVNKLQVKKVENTIKEELKFSDIKQAAINFDIATDEELLELSNDVVEDLISHAITAPSGGNCQPWKWVYYNKHLFLFHDKYLSESFLDFKSRGAFLSFGAAFRNIELRSEQIGLVAFGDFLEERRDNLIAVYSFKQKSDIILDSNHNLLANTIKKRLTNRKIGLKKSLDSSIISNLQAIASANDDFGLCILESEDSINAVAKVVGRMERLRMLNKQSHTELFEEVRWSDDEARSTQNGIDINTLELNMSDKAGLSLLKDWKAMSHLRSWDLGKGFINNSSKGVRNSSAIGLLYCKNHTNSAVFEGGKILQDLWLSANAQEIAFQPVSPSTFMFYRLLHPTDNLDSFIKMEMMDAKSDFDKIFKGISEYNHLFLFRLFYAEEPTIKSYRFDMDKVLRIVNTKDIA